MRRDTLGAGRKSRRNLDVTGAAGRPRDRGGARAAVLEREHPRIPAGDGRLGLGGRIAAVLLLVAIATVARGEGPLSAADVVRFLRAQISESTILVELKSRGFAEPLDDARERMLREAGATETLIVALRRAAPAEKTATPSAP